MMEAEASTLRSGRRWRRRPSPSPRGLEAPESTEAEELPSGSSGPRAAAELFTCCVCLETAKDPVVTRCGHLFCWPCLYGWVQRCHPRGACPICRSLVAVEPGDLAGVIPIYGTGGEGDEDLAPELPPRPRMIQVPSEADALEALRQKLFVLGRDMDALERRMYQVMGMAAELLRPLLTALEEEAARRNDALRTSVMGTRRRNAVSTQNNDARGEGVYQRTRSRTRQANP